MFKNNLFRNSLFNFPNHLIKTSKFGFRNLIKEKTGLSFKLSEAKSSKSLGYILFGISIGGFSYLGYQNYVRTSEYQKSLFYNPFASSQKATERVKSTLLYFAGGICTTSALVAFMIKNPRIIQMSSSMWSLFLTLPGLILCGYQLRSIPNDSSQNNMMKHAFWLGLNTFMAFSISPLIAFTEMKVISDAFILTSGAFGGLAFTAFNSHDTAFLGMSGILGAGFGTLFAISLANIFFQSHALFNLWLYGGLALFIGITLYDMKNIQVRAQRANYFDPMSESVNVYYDFINIFVRLLYILQNNRKNK